MNFGRKVNFVRFYLPLLLRLQNSEATELTFDFAACMKFSTGWRLSQRPKTITKMIFLNL